MVGNARRSLRELSAEVAANPDSTAFVELAAAYRERGDLDRAVRLCLRGLERHPTHVEAHFELGRIYEAQGERELALDEWSIVRSLAPEHLAARCASARLFLEEGRIADAEGELRDARELAPDNRTVRALWMQLQEQRGDGSRRDTARRAFDAVEFEFPGTLGVLLVNSEGKVLAGDMSGLDGGIVSELAQQLWGARDEAERVASYLELGSWGGMVVETDASRFAVLPSGGGVLVVATAPDVPAGRAARVGERALEVAAAVFQDGTR